MFTFPTAYKSGIRYEVRDAVARECTGDCEGSAVQVECLLYTRTALQEKECDRRERFVTLCKSSGFLYCR